MSPRKSSKKKARATLSPSLFKVKGANAKMKTDAKKRKLFYFTAKVKPEKARKLAIETGAEILQVPESDVKAGKPALKYDFYCTYDADLHMKFVRIRKEELGVVEGLIGAMVGKEVVTPKKGKTVPGKALFLDVVELFEINRTDALTLDGSTGTSARSIERLLKGPGMKKATPAWIRKVKVSPGKLNSLDKVVSAVEKMARIAPSEAKRIVEHKLTFTTLSGFYVPTYYVRVSAEGNSKIMRVNAVNGNVALKV